MAVGGLGLSGVSVGVFSEGLTAKVVAGQGIRTLTGDCPNGF
jgi:hypothetical protein